MREREREGGGREREGEREERKEQPSRNVANSIRETAGNNLC